MPAENNDILMERFCDLLQEISPLVDKDDLGPARKLANELTLLVEEWVSSVEQLNKA